MKTRALFLISALLVVCGVALAAPPEPGPVDAGLRLRLVVLPRPEGGKEGFDVRLDLMNVSREDIPVKRYQPPDDGGVKDSLEADVSIESYPEIAPWIGQEMARFPARVPEYVLKPGETLSLRWHTTGRHLKNHVSKHLEVQNPEFTEPGLYSIHASVVLTASGRTVRLRSNEQLVSFGGSYASPKHTYGRLLNLLWIDEKKSEAMFSLGSMDKTAVGDKFFIGGHMGPTWTLTITRVEADCSFGDIQPSKSNLTPAMPSVGMSASLMHL